MKPQKNELEVSLKKIDFKPGDKILVSYPNDMGADEIRELHRFTHELCKTFDIYAVVAPYKLKIKKHGD